MSFPQPVGPEACPARLLHRREKKKKLCSSLARYPSALAFEVNSSQLTGLKLGQLGLALIRDTADPARKSETDRQHVPDTQE